MPLPVVLVAFLLVPLVAAAQPPVPAAAPEPERADPDVRVNLLQPDFNLAALPTTLRMPAGKWAFRVTHRFARALGEGDFGDLVSDLFGFDAGAQIGLELRYGLVRGTQIGVHRTSERTIQLFAQHSILNERDGAPLGLDAFGTFEGRNNLREHHQGAVAALVSRSIGRRAIVHAEPMLAMNSNPLAAGDNHTLMLGVGGRLRVRPSTYLLAEVTPRIAGYAPGANQISVGIESRAGGHLFQINVSNGFGTTIGQLARGGTRYEDWYIGFNISRKFF